MFVRPRVSPPSDSPTNESRIGNDGGFSLIELLIVVIIIGILAAIAIPTFLAQRERAQSAAVQSDLRNAATSATACAADNDGSYRSATLTCDIATLTATYDFNQTERVEFSEGSVIEADRWAVSARHTANPNDTIHHFDTDDDSQVKEGALGDAEGG